MAAAVAAAAVAAAAVAAAAVAAAAAHMLCGLTGRAMVAAAAAAAALSRGSILTRILDTGALTCRLIPFGCIIMPNQQQQ